MSMNTKQFEQLTEMGISLWQSRSCDDAIGSDEIIVHDDHSIKSTTNSPMHSVASFLAMNEKAFDSLIKKQLFNDILLALGLSVGEIHLREDHIDAGLFNWYFITPERTKTADTDVNTKKTIRYINNKLYTPCIDDIEHSISLKKQLWGVFHQQIKFNVS